MACVRITAHPHDDAADFECEGAYAERGLLGAVVLLK
jgi:hypothetical protein